MLIRRFLFCLLFVLFRSILMHAQFAGFEAYRSGEILTYFSPYHEFADQSMLTRANGNSPVVFLGEKPAAPNQPQHYRFLIGHSTGTSSGERDFDIYCNNQFLFTFHTKPGMRTGDMLKGQAEDGSSSFSFQSIEQDINGDAFGFLNITLNQAPADSALFRITGRNSESRDWLMVFMYHAGWKMQVFPTSLVLRDGHNRQVNFCIDSPWPDRTQLTLQTRYGNYTQTLHPGYQTFSLALYPEDFAGTDSVICILNGKILEKRIVELTPVRHFNFHIIHHSHNDIGYSNLQTEVARIQNENIRSAMRWIDRARQQHKQVYWHIESLWAVENFLQEADDTEANHFAAMVRAGNLVLSANYANLLTGLCQPEELSWMTEYARHLEQLWKIRIRNAMITDIPGISYWGLKSYADHHIPYLSLGPNYVASLPDQGDRIGGILRETGDKLFFWKASNNSDDSVLVWTAGKGYSCFHGIVDKEKQFKWEQRISAYVKELTDKHYPFDMVQLRYTTHADNGPVDTLLDTFVDDWNQRYASPTLQISSIDSLYPHIIEQYGKQIPVQSGGEMSPYWEDGAYSSAREETAVRTLVRKTLAMEHWAKAHKVYNHVNWYTLHRAIVMFQEHTWGSWCSISDPELPFSTAQWLYKKNFADNGLDLYQQLATALGYTAEEDSLTQVAGTSAVYDFEVDSLHGGLKNIQLTNGRLALDPTDAKPFQLIYQQGIVATKTEDPVVTNIIQRQNDETQKETEVQSHMTYFPTIMTTYHLDKIRHILSVSYTLHKEKNIQKESLHIAFPVTHDTFEYGDGTDYLHFPEDQLPGSNHEFICTPGWLRLTHQHRIIRCYTPDVALLACGQLMDEHQENGVKPWKKENKSSSPLYFYALNNYWHTNYKAWQDGELHLHFTLYAE